MSLASLLVQNNLPVGGSRSGYLSGESGAGLSIDLMQNAVFCQQLADGTYLMSAKASVMADDNSINDCYLVNAAIKVSGGTGSIVSPMPAVGNAAKNIIRCSNGEKTRFFATGTPTSGASLSLSECDTRVDDPSGAITITIGDAKALRGAGSWELVKVN